MLRFESCLQHIQRAITVFLLERFFQVSPVSGVLGLQLIILMVAGWYDIIRKISVVKYGNCVLYIDVVCVYMRVCLSLLPIPLIPSLSLSLGKIDWVILLFSP